MKLRNPFIRRIARHLNVSTLFRRPDPAADEPTRRPVHVPALNSGGAFPAVAVLLPESRMLSLPLGYAEGASGTLPPLPLEVSGVNETQQAEERIQQAERYTQTAPRMIQSAPVSQKAVQPIVQPPATPVYPPAAPPEPGDAPADALTREWPRLQAIMRGHEAVQNTTIEHPPAPAAAPTTPAGQTRVSVPRAGNPPLKPVVMEMDHDRGVRTPGSPATIASTPQQTAPVPQTPVQAKTEPALPIGKPEPAPLPFDGRLSEQTEPALSPAPQTEPHLAPVDLPSAQTSARGLDEPVPVPQTTDHTQMPEVPAGISHTVQTMALKDPAVQSERPESSPTLPPRQTAPETYERKPLQEVWPVQRQIETPPSTAQINPVEAETRSETDEATVVPPDLHQIRQIEAALEGVAVSQPTDSRVELITPRRPRPGTPFQAKPVSQPVDALQSTPQTLAEKQEMQESPSVETVIQPASAASAPRTGPVSSASSPAEPPQMVETEIGPLPADLWQLMGAEPPAGSVIPNENPVETSVTHRAEPPARDLAGQPSIFDEAILPAPEAEIQNEPLFTSPAGQTKTPLHSITPLIQRTAQIGEVETEVSQEPASGETNTSTGGQASGSTQAQGEQQQNVQLSPAAVDKLVREVYAQIKRRFSIERERLHKD